MSRHKAVAGKYRKQSGMEPRIRAHKRLYFFLLGLATLLGGFVAALTLLPRVSVIPSDPVDSGNSMSASFTVINNNFIPLRHVTALLGIGQLRSVLSPPLDTRFTPTFETRVVRTEWKNHSLDMDDRFTITPGDAFGEKWGEADIAIIIVYQPWILPWKREKLFRFRTHRQTNGNLYWYSLPPN